MGVAWTGTSGNLRVGYDNWISVDKPKKRGSGFSTAKPASPPKLQAGKNNADHAAKEQQAAALINQGILQEAEVIYRALIAAGTNNHVVYSNLAAICGQTNRVTEALQLLIKGSSLNPSCPNIHNNLGTAYLVAGQTKLAAKHYKASTEIEPSQPNPWLGLGNVFLRDDQIKEAIKCFQKYKQLGGPREACSLNLSYVLMENGNIKEAIQELYDVINSKAIHQDASYNLSMLLLLTGNYKAGWKLYSNRFRNKKPITADAKPKAPQLPLRANPSSKDLLVVSEQGIGDILQFMRYIKPLRDRGYTTTLAAPAKLHSLIQQAGIDSSPLTPAEADNVENGHWIPLMTLPGYLEVSPSNPLTTEPYIKATERQIGKWREILATEDKPIVGINWQGDPSHENENLKGRSIKLEAFLPVAQTTNATLLSLQKGFGSEQLEICSFRDRFVSCQPQVDETWDFLETAAIIANCDLVITSDTSVAHLAGGMGKTTWLLLKKVPEWRWGLEGETTFWYPSIRLFRQRERGDWDEVLQRVAEALQEEFPGISK